MKMCGKEARELYTLSGIKAGSSMGYQPFLSSVMPNVLKYHLKHLPGHSCKLKDISLSIYENQYVLHKLTTQLDNQKYSHAPIIPIDIYNTFKLSPQYSLHNTVQVL